jgi:hypothetical protein
MEQGRPRGQAGTNDGDESEHGAGACDGGDAAPPSREQAGELQPRSRKRVTWASDLVTTRTIPGCASRATAADDRTAGDTAPATAAHGDPTRRQGGGQGGADRARRQGGGHGCADRAGSEHRTAEGAGRGRGRHRTQPAWSAQRNPGQETGRTRASVRETPRTKEASGPCAPTTAAGGHEGCAGAVTGRGRGRHRTLPAWQAAVKQERERPTPYIHQGCDCNMGCG